MSTIDKKPERIHPYFTWDLLEIDHFKSPFPYHYCYPAHFNVFLRLPEERRKLLIPSTYSPYASKATIDAYKEHKKKEFLAIYESGSLTMLVLIPEIDAYDRKTNTLFWATNPREIIDDYFLYQLSTFSVVNQIHEFLDFQYYYTEDKTNFIDYVTNLIEHRLKMGKEAFNSKLDIYKINMNRLRINSEFVYKWLNTKPVTEISEQNDKKGNLSHPRQLLILHYLVKSWGVSLESYMDQNYNAYHDIILEMLNRHQTYSYHDVFKDTADMEAVRDIFNSKGLEQIAQQIDNDLKFIIKKE